MAWDAILIILSVQTSSLFHYFLKNDQSLFKNIVVIMIERTNNILPNNIWMNWMNGTMGDHSILAKLDR